MSTESSTVRSRESTSSSDLISLSQYSFVKQSENVNASRTRRAVRSHAMRAVRRQQRYDSAKTFRLRWPEEQASVKRFQLTWPDELSSDFIERQDGPQTFQQESQDRVAINTTPPRERSKSTSRSRPQNDSQIFTNRQSDGVESLGSLETKASPQYISTEAEMEATVTGISARTLLGAGRIDPFQTFPVQADRSLSELVDHCMLHSHPFN